jgi:hypothetical protein
MMKPNRKLGSIKQQAAGTTALSVAFLALGGWLWTMRTDATQLAAIILCTWSAGGMFFAIKTCLRAHRPHQHGWFDGDEHR